MPHADPEIRRAYDRRRKRAARALDWRATLKTRAGGLAHFIGCDGEGYDPHLQMQGGLSEPSLGGGASARQEYGLLRIGPGEPLYTGKPLTPYECLSFIVDRPRIEGAVYVGYYFDYDCTMILRDLPPFIVERVLSGRYATWRGLVFEYKPRQYIRVGKAGLGGRVPPKSWVTINECGAFFQTKFVAALELWGIGSATERAAIASGKALRGSETEITPQTIRYNALECELLERLMRAFGESVGELDARPQQWRGPGWVAARVLRQKGVIRRQNAEKLIPSALAAIAPFAFYGGRFEVPQIGHVGRSWGHDLNSAYPAAMQFLPCLEHAGFVEWHGHDRKIRPHSLAFVEFDHAGPGAGGGPLCGVPIRRKGGGLVFPREGRGWYWGVELLSAAGLGAGWRTRMGWHIERRCECRPFGFVRELYRERVRVGKSTKGVALKLIYNSLYGKLVQHVGSRPFYNPIWAGLITAYVRSWINRAIAQNPDAISMIATDGIFSSTPLDLSFSKQLGAWEQNEINDLFIVQPGVYDAGGPRIKTRGIDHDLMQAAMQDFREIWAGYMIRRSGEPPSKAITIHAFTSLKLANARNKLETAGVWADTPKTLRFDWSKKRAPAPIFDSGFVRTLPQRGSPDLESVVYDPDSTVETVYREIAELLHGQPDHAVMSWEVG